MLSFEFQSHSITLIISRLTLFILLTLLAQREGVNIKNLLLGRSSNTPRILTSKYQYQSIKIENIKINPMNPFNPISTKRGSENLKPISRNVS